MTAERVTLRRRELLLGLGMASVGLAGWSPAERWVGKATAAQRTVASPDEALQLLMEGNQRFVAGSLTAPSEVVTRRAEVAPSQFPIAAIVSCADSRVPPELIFDRGLGDLFIVRLAGNIVDDAARGSIEFAVDGLGTPLVMVLGHERCGAVAAAVTAVQGGSVPNYLVRLTDAIAPAVRRVLGRPGDVVDNAIRANVEVVVEQLSTSDMLLADNLQEGRLRIVGAYYSLDTGVVSLIV